METDIAKEWEMFAQEEVAYRGEQGDVSVPKKYFVAFGKAMAKIVRMKGAAANALWADTIPIGTEDRLWYRVWLGLHGHPEHNMVYDFHPDPRYDTPTKFAMVCDFVAIGAVFDVQAMALLQAPTGELNCTRAIPKCPNGMFELRRHRQGKNSYYEAIDAAMKKDAAA